MWRIVHSPFGLCLKSVRDNPAKAEALGLGVTRYRWQAFVISAVYAAVGGMLLGPPTGNVDPTLAYWTQSGNIVFMTLLGGFASFFGPILGAFAFIFLQDTVMSFVPYWRLVFGAILAFVVIRAPGGLMGLFARPRAPALRARERLMILEARDVTVFYGDFCALAGVSLAVRDGEFVSIIGPNGAGKSTLINVLTGVLHPTSGDVRFNDRDVRGIGPVALARLGMARSFQLVHIFPDLTVLETLQAAVVSRLGRGTRLFASLAGDRQVQTQALEVAELFGLADKRHAASKHLPQGDKKLLDVASAFALRPEIILLDEPTSGVSTADKTGIMEILVTASRRIGCRAIIQVEHDMDIVFGYSDRIIALHEGKVLADAPPAAIRENRHVVDTVIGRLPDPA